MIAFVLLLAFCAAIFVLIVSITGIYFWISSHGFQTAPPVPTSGRIKQALLNDITQQLAAYDTPKTIIDLGSGWGTLLLPLAQQFPSHRFIGVEKAFLPYIISRFRTRHFKNICLYRQDLFDFNISQADIIVFFLLAPLMPRITTKCCTEMKKNAILYSNRFALINLSPSEKISFGSDYETIYKYVF